MTNEAAPIEIAKKKLRVRNIYLQSSEIKTADDLDREEINNSDHTYQFFHGCERLKIFEAEEGEIHDELEKFMYRFSYSAGIRLIKEFPESGDEPETLVEIIAVFDVFYTSTEQVPEESTNAFADENLRYHVWPYWREYVQAVCGRIGIAPAFEIPSYMVGKDGIQVETRK